MACPLPLSSLRLLVPPLRLLTAAMWQVALQQSVKHYGMLEDFVSLVTETMPQLLTDRQRSLLLMALRAKMTLCDTDTQAVNTHMDKTHSQTVSMATSDEEADMWSSVLSTLTNKLTPRDRQRLLQDVFNHSFDSALLRLISDFLSRIEQLLPVPDFKQAASWLHADPSGLEVCLQEANSGILRDLLANQSGGLGRATITVDQDSENVLLSTWSHPLLSKPPNPEPPVSTLDQSGSVLDVELVKVEVVVLTEDEVEETVIGVMSPLETETSNESLEGRRDCDVTPVIVEDRIKDTPINHVDQSQVIQLDQWSPAVTQRVAHKCPRCGKCFIYRSQVIRHLRTNKSCGSALPSPVNLQSVQVEPHPSEPRSPRSVSCFQCSATFKTKPELLSHQRMHRPRQVYYCGLCSRQFHHLSSLTNHKQTHLERGGLTCSRCDKVFHSSKERDVHQLQHRELDLSCSICHEMFTSQARLLRHLQTHSVEGAEPRYCCRFCDQSFSGVTQLRIHQRSHASRSFSCDLCGKSYGSLTGLTTHRAAHAADRRFLCPQCGKRFKTRDGLEGHLRTHTGERPYHCPFCSKDFTALAGLNVHVRRHTGERPYVCSVCGKGWPSGGDLQKHLRTHTGEKPYVCQDCGKAFSISCHLTEHRRIHTGEKPFSCPDCGKCLRRKFDLKKHMLSHSSIRPFACTHCTKSYTRKTHLNRHLLTHRSDDRGGGGGGEA